MDLLGPVSQPISHASGGAWETRAGVVGYTKLGDAQFVSNRSPICALHTEISIHLFVGCSVGFQQGLQSGEDNITEGSLAGSQLGRSCFGRATLMANANSMASPHCRTAVESRVVLECVWFGGKWIY